MGVIYKLKDEVVNYIISQRQSNPLYSCRQLAESASQKFDLRLSKSSVHDVLKESGIITPRGRKPKVKFEIPQEKKKQIQTSLSQVKLLPDPVESSPEPPRTVEPEQEVLSSVKELNAIDIVESSPSDTPPSATGTSPSITVIPAKAGIQDRINSEMKISPEYEGAGKIFLKAALWDLGVFSEENIKEADWDYYLTYSKGIKVVLENNKNFFIDLPLPIERCIKEAADGLINNVFPLIIPKVSDEELFQACMNAKTGYNIENVTVVDQNDHTMFLISDLVVEERAFVLNNRIFVENSNRDIMERSKALFFPQVADNISFTERVLNLKGFDSTDKYENLVTLIIRDDYDNKGQLQEAVERLNGMCLRDEQNKLVKVKISIAC